MSSRFPRLTADQARTVSIEQRPSKVPVDACTPAPAPGRTVAELVASLPDILAGSDFKSVVAALAQAARRREPVIWATGAHLIKCGLSRHLIALMERGIVSAVALNGAGAVHDVELALFGKTSEDVSAQMSAAEFGMAREPCDFLNAAAAGAQERESGFGESIGHAMLDSGGPHLDVSLLAAGARLGIPVTVHVAIGGDINHIHPSMNGAATGAASHRDFEILAHVVSRLVGQGVLMLTGSAVVLPVVIEKTIALARNLGHEVGGFTGVNFDFIRHYRPALNPVQRAIESGGAGYTLTGHHEILIPLLTHALLDELERSDS